MKSERKFSCREADSGDTSAPTNRIAAGCFRSLKSVGRREHGNVMRNYCVLVLIDYSEEQKNDRDSSL